MQGREQRAWRAHLQRRYVLGMCLAKLVATCLPLWMRVHGGFVYRIPSVIEVHFTSVGSTHRINCTVPLPCIWGIDRGNTHKHKHGNVYRIPSVIETHVCSHKHMNECECVDQDRECSTRMYIYVGV